MQFLSLEPFVPSGPEFEKSKSLFLEIGFSINWDAGDYVGFGRDGCSFILQKFNDKGFAENFMISVKIDNAENFWQEMTAKDLAGKFGVRMNRPVPTLWKRSQPHRHRRRMLAFCGIMSNQ
jgi:hypothetical protein